MEKKKKNVSLRQELKEYGKNRKAYYDEIDEQLYHETYEANEFKSRLNHYNKTKKMKWWSYLTSFAIAFFFTGLSFLIGYLTRNSAKTPDYQATGWASLGFTVLIVLVFMGINYAKNKDAQNYWGDKRRRYQRTLSESEAKKFLALKILSLAFILMTIVTIVTNIVFQ